MGSLSLELIMNGLVVLAACVCACTGQVLVNPARAIYPGQSHQFHAQDEFGQFSFGHAGGPSARTESRAANGVTQGSYQYVDANGLLQTVNYIADPFNGFRVSGTNLPAAPLAPAVVALEGPAPVRRPLRSLLPEPSTWLLLTLLLLLPLLLPRRERSVRPSSPIPMLLDLLPIPMLLDLLPTPMVLDFLPPPPLTLLPTLPLPPP